MADNDKLSRLTDDLVKVMGEARDAQGALLTAKEDLPMASERSTRAMVNTLAGFNSPLSEEDTDTLASDVTLKLYGKPHKVRKSELKVFIETRSKLQQALTGVDGILARMRQDDPKATLNISAQLLTLCRRIRDMPARKVTEHVDDLRKKIMHKSSRTERVLKALDRIGKEELLQTSVGDEKVLYPDVEAAIQVIQGRAMGKRVGFESTPAFQKAVADRVGEAVAAAREKWEEEQTAPQPAPEATQTPEEPEEVPDTTQEPEAAPTPDAAAPVAKKPLMQPESTTGLGFNELLGFASDKK
jgi:hypothetical protein